MSNDAKKVWRRRAARYIARGHYGPGRQLALREWNAAAAVWTKSILPVEGRIVDFGAGNGGFWEVVAEKYNVIRYDVIGLDIARAFSATQLCPTRLVANACNAPFLDSSIDCIVALGLIEYIDDLDSLFSGWRHLIKLNGKLLLTNSPPTIPNRLRKLFGMGAIPRADEIIVSGLERNGWNMTIGSPVRAGWQSIMTAQAV